MTRVLVCIPTLTGREAYLENCIRSYQERTPEASLAFAIVHDAPSCGEGWNQAASVVPDCDYVHFSNDDIVVTEGWLPPLIQACKIDCIPAPRIEPAGVALNDDSSPTPPTMLGPVPRYSRYGYFYADLPENQPTRDFQEVDHGALPFCSWQQFKRIGPFIPTHFGTDKWFYVRARDCGYQIVARQGSVIYNYAAQVGRSKGDWTEQDFLDFDLTVAYPMYMNGELAQAEAHPLRCTPEGLALVRDWRRRTFND